MSTLDNDGKYPFIFIDESKGDGTAPFDLSPFDTNLFTVSEEKLSQITVTLDSDLGPNIPTLVVSGISQSGSATVISGTSVAGDGSSGFTITSLGDVSSYESLEVSVSDGNSNTPDPKTTISLLPEITGTFLTSNSSISLSVGSSLASTEASNIVVSGISQSGSATVISDATVEGDGSSGFTISNLGNISSFSKLKVSINDDNTDTPNPSTDIEILSKIDASYGLSDQSIYTLNFNKDLPNPTSDLTGTDYGIFLEDPSGNKSSEAVKVIFNSVDKYGHEVYITEKVAGYKLSVTSGPETSNIILNVVGAGLMTPNAILDGTNHYIFNPQFIGTGANPLNETDKIEFEITLPSGQKFLSQI